MISDRPASVRRFLPITALMLCAAGAVIASLVLLRSVWAVFAVYHLGICLLLPGVLLGREGKGMGASLGLLPPAGDAHGKAGRWRPHLVLGLALGLAGGALLLGANELLGARYLEGDQVSRVLGAWGVTPGRVPLAAAFMVLVNGPAEEIFWRGFIFHRLQGLLGTRELPGRWLAVPSFFYASYHAVTVFLFMASVPMAALVLVNIFLAGWGWAWLRRHTGSLWPALLSHLLLTGAYVVIWLGLE